MAEMKHTFESLVKDKSVEQLLKLARMTENAERYDDMCKIMGKICQEKKQLDVEERNMLSVAYKNVVGQRRSSWRALKGEINADSNNPQQPSQAVQDARKDYQNILETELFVKCQEVLGLLKAHLLVSEAEQEVLKKALSDADEGSDAQTAAQPPLETQVFYLKMSGDYYRYLAEFQATESHKNNAHGMYDRALKLAEALPPTHPTRLGLALNASVCFWEILKKQNEACELAKKAFDEAIQKLDSLSDSTYKDSTLIMQLLRDNLTIWTTEDTQRDTQNPNEEA